MSTAAHKGTVFVIDDDETLRCDLQELLEADGYLVLEARNGAEAVRRMRGIATECLVALVDLMMPDVDGWQLIATMRKDPELARIPIIVLTAHGPGPVEGADLVLVKPVSAEQVLAVVRRYCLPVAPLPSAPRSQREE